ncbi:hypothetical protein PAPYR_12028 [Paratrimastix pyriformis]|uniref:Uncharacterized protein n=1 Tax=Paratrimastix pyriformis TaxID=342808 RepID=A0ABQ8U2N4_9EUKA|nr:hypothetical protein PAPYR_12028 [Paratrimastix pyriformis]
MVFTLSWFGSCDFIVGVVPVNHRAHPTAHLSREGYLLSTLKWRSIRHLCALSFGNSTPARQGCLHRFTGADVHPRAGRDPLEEMFGVRMVDHVSLVVFIETFGSCDSQLDWFYCVARY